MATPRTTPPRDLCASGTALWRSIIEHFQPDPTEVPLLDQLRRAVDILDRLHADLADMGVVVSGSTGQPKVNPLLAEIREQSRLIDHLTTALAVPVGDEQIGQRRTAQAKAQAREPVPRKIKSGGRVTRLARMYNLNERRKA